MERKLFILGMELRSSEEAQSVCPKAGLGLWSEFTGHRFASLHAQGSCAPGQRIAQGYLVRNGNRRQLTKKEKALPRMEVD